ncbi:MAG: hypothetical protein AAFZ17_01490 [Cyanobacteria bacterium J06650_10]
MRLNSNQRKTYDAIWAEPVTRKLTFARVDKLLTSICENRVARKGSPNIAFEHKSETWGMHRPHPDRGLKKCYIQQIREFLIGSGLKEDIEQDD